LRRKALKALLTSFDLLLITLAVTVSVVGLARRWSQWYSKKPAGIKGDWAALKASVINHREIFRRPDVGWAHLAVFWGVVLPMIIIVLAQLGFAIPKFPAAILSIIQDLAGVALIAGSLFLLLRRAGIREAGGPVRTRLPMILLLVIGFSGFLAAGARISLGAEGSMPWSSPVGWVFSLVAPASPLFMQMMIRLHFFTVILFVASLPFTFMRHVVASPLNVFYHKRGPKAALRELSPEKGDIGAENASDFSWKQLLDADACVACGRCDEKCPATLSGKPLSPRKVVQTIRAQTEVAACNGNGPRLMDVLTADEIWACTNCMACVETCPVYVEPLDKIIDIRRHLVLGEGHLPHEARPMIRDLALYGDVQGKGAAHRADWAMHKDIPLMSDLGDDGAELLLWVGCSGAFHPRNQETTRAMARILKAAGIRFGILGKEEVCCGDPARRLGEETLFQSLAKKNMDAFARYGVKKIVTLCPHCLNTLKNEYPAVRGGRIEVVHSTELVNELIRDGRITLKYPVAGTMTIHDACFLGRYNEVYEAPREICRAVPGSAVRELPRNRENGFCCGGGGGRMWLHENIGENINLVRAKEIAETPVDLIGTACPYCLVMLDDGIKSLELEKTPKVADIIDIVADALA
jgi:Fe-S oxidoreductase/nitrate reductase gamma subunit